jgi:hypothetical protein
MTAAASLASALLARLTAEGASHEQSAYLAMLHHGEPAVVQTASEALRRLSEAGDL